LNKFKKKNIVKLYKMSEVFENGTKPVAEPKPEKKKRKRKPLTEDQKKALVER